MECPHERGKLSILNLEIAFLAGFLLKFLLLLPLQPTIFGTVASDQSPKDISSRRVRQKPFPRSLRRQFVKTFLSLSLPPQGLPQTVSGHQVISSASESSVKDFESDENVSVFGPFSFRRHRLN
jgi:hypothetical protein